MAPLSLLLLQLGAPPEPLALHHDPWSAPRAWAAAIAGQLWVCWDGPLGGEASPDPQCWRRIPLELAIAPRDAAIARIDPSAELRVAFRDPDTLWIFAPGQGAWIIGRDGLAVSVEDAFAEVELAPLQPLPCARDGWLPTRIDGRWRWSHAPCDPAADCRQRPRLRRRAARATGVHLDLAVDVVLLRGLTWRTGSDSQLDGQALVTVGLQFDARRGHLDRQALRRWRQPDPRRGDGLPRARSTGALAGLERAALERAQCRAWEALR
ncbi:MAG: hypothetical protein R3A79_08845 [Nannocystaceae bacterium]